jgi:hypothetical protein
MVLPDLLDQSLSRRSRVRWRAAARAHIMPRIERMSDHSVRDLQRALAAAPGDRALRERLARAHLRAGAPEAACATLGVRWEVDLTRLPALAWGSRPLAPDEVQALVEADLAALDPVAVSAAFPRRADGAWRLNATRFLRRYRAHEPGQPGRRLVLFAWTPGTASLWERPDDRGRDVLTIGLATRTTYREDRAWAARLWRSA